MNFKEENELKVKEIEEILNAYLPEEEGYQKIIMEAMKYSLMAGGKRIRPMLMKETFDMFGGTSKIIEPFMAAQEMIHTYSLVHDDLPAMDNDEYRRGKLTTHAKYGHAMGILAGDGLLNYAFETAADAFRLEKEPEALKRIAHAMQILGEKAGIYGMIGGQVVDVESTGRQVDLDQLLFIYERKTSALLEASMMIGAVLAGATEAETKTVEQAASDVGIAFQIRDDILDVTSTLEMLGKPIHSDERNEKTTYVTLKGLEQAAKDVEEISERALSRLDSLPYKNEFLTELIRSLIDRDQ